MRGDYKDKARWRLYRAIKRGEVVKPTHCSRCEKQTPSGRLHGHHADYSKPLDVIWVCFYCHGLVHREARAA